MRKSMRIQSFLVLEVKTFPDRSPDATGRPGGSQEGLRRVPREPRGKAQEPSRAALEPPQGRPRELQGSPKGQKRTKNEAKMEPRTPPRPIQKEQSETLSLFLTFLMFFSILSQCCPAFFLVISCEPLARFSRNFYIA